MRRSKKVLYRDSMRPGGGGGGRYISGAEGEACVDEDWAKQEDVESFRVFAGFGWDEGPGDIVVSFSCGIANT